jgi:hypothetical protein
VLTKEVLAHKYVKRLFLARFISNFGNGMGPIALAFGILAFTKWFSKYVGICIGHNHSCLPTNGTFWWCDC